MISAEKIFTILSALFLIPSLSLAKPPSQSGLATQINDCGIIDKSGHYIVTNNLSSTDTCITINADFVSIDLGGFSLSGDGAGEGISDGGTPLEGIVIRNGTIAGFNFGILLEESTSIRVSEVHLTKNSTDGMSTGIGSIVRNSIASSNGRFGLVTKFGSTVIDNVAHNNTRHGIVATGVITNNVSYKNGFDGFGAGNGSTVIGNTAHENGDRGFTINLGCSVINNTAYLNRVGFHVSCGSNFSGNTSVNNSESNLTSIGSGCTYYNNLGLN